MFGLGTQEILLLLVLGCGIAAVVAIVLFLSRRGDSSRVAALEEENRRLREALDRREGRP